MNRVLEKINSRYLQRKEYPNFKVGDTVKVHYRIKEGDRERIQPFEGVVIRIAERTRPLPFARSRTA